MKKNFLEFVHKLTGATASKLFVDKPVSRKTFRRKYIFDGNIFRRIFDELPRFYFLGFRQREFSPKEYGAGAIPFSSWSSRIFLAELNQVPFVCGQAKSENNREYSRCSFRPCYGRCHFWAERETNSRARFGQLWSPQLRVLGDNALLQNDQSRL